MCQTTSRTAAVWNQSLRPTDSLQAAAVTADASSNQTCRKTCLFTKQYVAYGEIGHFFVFCDFPR